jgi:hypothetical protein
MQKSRVLIVASTTGYQTRSFGEAASRQNIGLIFATDRCTALDDPWRDSAIPVRFHDEDQSVATIAEALSATRVDGVLALGDRPTIIAARAAEMIGLPAHPVDAARASQNKFLTKERWRQAGVRIAPFRHVRADADPQPLARDVEYPCVLKPVVQSGSRGVIRADDPEEFVSAFERVRALLHRRDVRAQRDPAGEDILVERYIPGREFAVEGILEQGRLTVLAVFDKPDPLDGPYFEETIYVTPSREPADVQAGIRSAVASAAAALGLWHGPIHAECRVDASQVYMLEIAARPIGGLCARALRFIPVGRHYRSEVDVPMIDPDRHGSARPEPGEGFTLEDVLLRHAVGDLVRGFVRERQASGVMMIPIRRRGYYKGVDGVDQAKAVEGVDDVRITAKQDQLLVPLPEGASYLGFIFAHADNPADVEQALRTAHAALRIRVERQPVLI